MTEITSARTFANNFWGKDDAGYRVLTQKMSMAKKTCEDLKSLYSLKATLHEEFGKKLIKHLRSCVDREETGTLHALMTSARRELEISAQNNIDLAQKIRMNLEVSLDNFITEQKDRRKLIQSSVDKAHRNKQLHTSHVNKAKEKYEAEYAKFRNLEHQIRQANSREVDRLRLKLDRSQNEIGMLEKEYQNACARLADATAIWNSEWKNACDSFQLMEEKRAEFIHHSLSVYVNIESTVSGQEHESNERLWKSLDQWDPKADIEQFIREKGTGSQIPEAPVYVNYFEDPAKTLPRYQVANFDSNSSSNNSSSNTKVTVPVPLTPSKSVHKTLPEGVTRRAVSVCEKNVATTATTTTAATTSTTSATTTKPSRSFTTDDHVNTIAQRAESWYRFNEPSTPPKKPAPATKTESSVMDEIVDPRAKVVLSIGQNMFSVNQDAQDTPQEPSTNLREQPRHRSTRYSTLPPSPDSFDISIKDLLKELGVMNASATNGTSDSAKSKNESSSVDASLEKSRCNKMQPTLGQEASAAATIPSVLQTQDEPSPPPPATTTTTTTTPEAEAYIVHGYPILAWATALYDYQGNHKKDLSFKKGDWLAIVHMDHNSWWWGYKWNKAKGCVASHDGGYVSPGYIQLYG